MQDTTTPAAKAKAAHFEATQVSRLTEECARSAAERPLGQYDRGLYTVEELTEQLILVLNRDFSGCVAGQHTDERARVKHQTDWWQCTVCHRLEPMTRGEKVAAGLVA